MILCSIKAFSYTHRGEVYKMLTFTKDYTLYLILYEKVIFSSTRKS